MIILYLNCFNFLNLIWHNYLFSLFFIHIATIHLLFLLCSVTGMLEPIPVSEKQPSNRSVIDQPMINLFLDRRRKLTHTCPIVPLFRYFHIIKQLVSIWRARHLDLCENPTLHWCIFLFLILFLQRPSMHAHEGPKENSTNVCSWNSWAEGVQNVQTACGSEG